MDKNLFVHHDSELCFAYVRMRLVELRGKLSLVRNVVYGACGVGGGDCALGGDAGAVEDV